MSLSNIALLALLGLSSTALASPAPGTAAAPAAPLKEKKICRSEVPVGSIMARRTCLTRAQWKSLEERNGEAAETAIEYVRARSNAGISTEQ